MDIHTLVKGIENCECGKSHACPMDGILTGKPYLAHGIDVVYAAVLTAKIREQILTI